MLRGTACTQRYGNHSQAQRIAASLFPSSFAKSNGSPHSIPVMCRFFKPPRLVCEAIFLGSDKTLGSTRTQNTGLEHIQCSKRHAHHPKPKNLVAPIIQESPANPSEKFSQRCLK